MIPWNPIHRYAGMTSLFDSLDEQQQPPRDLPLARFGGSSATPQPDAYERMPLGFVDVRAEGRRTATARSSRSAEFAVEPSRCGRAARRADGRRRRRAGAEEKVPFYKREISFGRKKDESAVEASASSDAESPEAGRRSGASTMSGAGGGAERR